MALLLSVMVDDKSLPDDCHLDDTRHTTIDNNTRHTTIDNNQLELVNSLSQNQMESPDEKNYSSLAGLNETCDSSSSSSSSSDNNRTNNSKEEGGGYDEEDDVVEIDVVKLVQEQKLKFGEGDRAMSPPFGIPVECYTIDKTQPPHKIKWIECQQKKYKRIIYDDRFQEAIKMIADGRAELLVENGLNMYGDKINEGKNFFDKPLNEEYDMYDWVPRWVRNCNSQLYFSVKRGV